MTERQEQIKFLASVIAQFHAGEGSPMDNPDYWVVLAGDRKARQMFYKGLKAMDGVKQVDHGELKAR